MKLCALIKVFDVIMCCWGHIHQPGIQLKCVRKIDICINPESKIHGANMGPTWVLLAPDEPQVGPMNLDALLSRKSRHQSSKFYHRWETRVTECGRSKWYVSGDWISVRMSFTSKWVPVIKTIRSHDNWIFIMGIPIPAHGMAVFTLLQSCKALVSHLHAADPCEINIVRSYIWIYVSKHACKYIA